LLDLSEARLGYGDKAILEKVKLQLVPGARIGLLGPNGAGKSTLIKNLAGELSRWPGAWPAARTSPSATSPSISSTRWTPRPARCCTCSAWRPTEREQTLRDFLGGFDFRGARRRAGAEFLRWRKGPPGPGADRLGTAQPAAARRTDQPPRPGNAPGPDHGLAGVQWCRGGGLHDRHLLKSTTDDFLLVADGKVEPSTATSTTTPLAGGVPPAQRARQHAPVNPDKTDKKAQRQAAAALRQQLAAQAEADKLEAELGKVHEQLAKSSQPRRQRALRGGAQGRTARPAGRTGQAQATRRRAGRGLDGSAGNPGKHAAELEALS
jgi:ATP-binding cassette subfamily F protein 3